ncbi:MULTISPECIES: hypothetical protein [Brucella]|uniref:hypothetical protein n=1 Tax=Brucella TaxID=234 RepID=UPI0009899857|nr:hypothetical protein [Brucella intermedia]OOC51190.1 hypothetical protein AS855_01085 [Brucella intermedia M86]
MKRVNLLDYMKLSDTMADATRALALDNTKHGYLYFTFDNLMRTLVAFLEDDNGFDTSKIVAKELYELLTDWQQSHHSNGIDADKFGQEVHSWEYHHISMRLNAFKHVLEAECRQVDVYSVGQVSIYKTSSLVSNGSKFIPASSYEFLPMEAKKEFDDAGRCLAFDLPTAAGFHALRGLELAIHKYLEGFGKTTESLKNWGAYVKAVQDLADDDTTAVRPSRKVAAMLDRIRALDRNPLMHPQDTLDQDSADMLFRLVAVTVYEMAKDAKDAFGEAPLLTDRDASKPATGSIAHLFAPE